MAVHPTAILEVGVTIGHATVVAEHVRVRHSTLIGADCTIDHHARIGHAVTVADRVRIGCYARVDADSVVLSSVPDYAAVAGNPAALRGYVCACGLDLPFTGAHEAAQAACGRCRARYEITAGNVTPAGTA